MCARLVALLDHSGMSDSRAALLLDYKTPATISSVRRGTVFLDTERLARFGTLILADVAKPNLHWLLTGEGDPFCPAPTKVREAAALSVLVKSKVVGISRAR